MKRFAQGFAACWLIIGLMGGFGMQRLIPALNGWGVLYIAATYPFGMACAAAGLPCSNVPAAKDARWLFTFKSRSLSGEG